MKYILQAILLILMADRVYSQSYSIDVTNHPDSGISIRNENLVRQKITSIKRNEFTCNEKRKLTPSGSYTYLVNRDGYIYEETFSDTNGNKGKCCYKYDKKGNVVLKEEFKIIKDKAKKEKQIAVKSTKFIYDYSYDRCISFVTSRNGKDSSSKKYMCGEDGSNRILYMHDNQEDTVLKFDLYDNLIEETKRSSITNQEIKKITYNYIYNKDKPVSIKKITAECIFDNSKSFWKYNLDYNKKFLYDGNGNVKNVLFTDSLDKPFKLYTYNYNFSGIENN